MIAKYNFEVSEAYVGEKEVVSMYLGETQVYSSSLPEDTYFYAKALSGNTTFTITTTAATLQYSVDNGKTWSGVTSGQGILVQKGKKIYLKGNNARLATSATTAITTSATVFTADDKFEVGGKLNSLLNGDNYDTPRSSVSAWTFACLFAESTNLENAEKLIFPDYISATTYTYYRMFAKCSNLVKAPRKVGGTKLTTAACAFMFSNCSSLTTAPELPATSLTSSTYAYMFQYCTSLTVGPELPATTVNGVYTYRQMFRNCSSLTVAPNISATTLGSSTSGSTCQYMFANCTALSATQETLFPTTLQVSAYTGMFSGCTSLTVAPKLPATTLVTACYNNMFRGCSSLNTIWAKFTTSPSTTYTNNWVTRVASSGTFHKATNASWTTKGTYACPTNWTLTGDYS